MIYGDVCTGISAATVAWHSLGWKPAFFSEIEAFPRAVLEHHYTTPVHGDFTTIGADEYGAIDLLVGGTPCQSFSIAGLRGGLDDDRGNLALEFLRLAQRKRPAWLVWENVPGVLSSNGGRDFGSILGGLGELGYGWAYRVLDAQYFGVAQRRRRVFVVGYLGDWRPAAAVLFERHSLQGHPAPRREKRQTAPTIPSRSSAGGGLGTDFDCDGGLMVMSSGQANAEVTREVSPTLNLNLNHDGAPIAFGWQNSAQQGDSCSTDVVPTLDKSKTPSVCITGDITHTLKAESFDASEDGTGRGQPIVCQPYTLAIRGRGDSHNLEYRQDGTANALLTPNGGRGGMGVGAIAFAQNQRDEVRLMDVAGALAAEPGMKQQTYVAQGVTIHGTDKTAKAASFADTAGALRTKPPGSIENSSTTAALHNSAVRRLTPVECERLQGFPDGYTAIPWSGKPASECPDGRRYKALGNSMAVPVMAWIGKRIAIVGANYETVKRSAVA